MDASTSHAEAAATLVSKPHYPILDGLRGVASVMVVIFHIFEPWSHEDATKQIINHGYLAVDFFFLLSGFVIAYAYDERWPRMSQWEFYKRRLIRLQPMVVVGTVIGAVLFYLQKGPAFPLIAATPVWKMLLVMLVGFTLIPLTPAMDIRGWAEMHPLNGPAWSLFFEYVANVLYAVGLRRLPKRILLLCVLLAAAFLAHLAVTGTRGDLIGGWSLTPHELHVGFARLLFPFLAGVLLMRSGRRIPVKGAFAVASALLLVGLSLPRFGGHQLPWLNGLYESACVILLFPVIVAVGAGDVNTSGGTLRTARFFGDLSYPLYLTHYPLIYIYTGWIATANPTPQRGALWGTALFVTAITMAYASLKLIDEPSRRWLGRRFVRGRND